MGAAMMVGAQESLDETERGPVGTTLKLFPFPDRHAKEAETIGRHSRSGDPAERYSTSLCAKE
jgi:hypothetical protein